MLINKKITQKVDEDQLFDMSYVNYANGVLRNCNYWQDTLIFPENELIIFKSFKRKSQ